MPPRSSATLAQGSPPRSPATQAEPPLLRLLREPEARAVLRRTAAEPSARTTAARTAGSPAPGLRHTLEKLAASSFKSGSGTVQAAAHRVACALCLNKGAMPQ